MELFDLLSKAGLSPEILAGNIHPVYISEIVTDSRRVEIGSLFLCLTGQRDNGHRYVRQALLRGASAIITEAKGDACLPEACQDTLILGVPDTRMACAQLYSAWYGHPSQKMKVVAVTGTNGKTTVIHMLKHIFEGALFRCGTIGTVQCTCGRRTVSAAPKDPLAHMTTPDPEQLYRLLAFMAAYGTDYVFMEASSHALKLHKVDAIAFESAAFTNLTPDHMDFHGTMEDYRQSKGRLFALSRLSLLNMDDAAYPYMKEQAAGPCFSYSALGNPAADFRAENVINRGCEGIDYTLQSKNIIMQLHCPLPGLFQLSNSLCAASMALCHGIQPTTVQSAFYAMPPVKGRMEPIRPCDVAQALAKEKVPLQASLDFTAFIDYAHTPDALEKLLDSARSMKKREGRVVLIFGCGGDRDPNKRPQMGKIASEKADYVILTADNSRSERTENIIAAILAGFSGDCPYSVIPERDGAIVFAVEQAQRDDILLFAGKGHETYEIDATGTHDFNEKQKIAQAMAERILRRKN